MESNGQLQETDQTADTHHAASEAQEADYNREREQNRK